MTQQSETTFYAVPFYTVLESVPRPNRHERRRLAAKARKKRRTKR